MVKSFISLIKPLKGTASGYMHLTMYRLHPISFVWPLPLIHIGREDGKLAYVLEKVWKPVLLCVTSLLYWYVCTQSFRRFSQLTHTARCSTEVVEDFLSTQTGRIHCRISIQVSPAHRRGKGSVITTL